MIKDNLNKLTTNDVYSLILFIIFKLNQIPEYAVLSELIYLMDKTSLLNLCADLGGATIKIPTIDELQAVLDALLVYCYVAFEHKPLDDALELLNRPREDTLKIKKIYYVINEVVTDYDFSR